MRTGASESAEDWLLSLARGRPRIEADLRAYLPALLDKEDAEMTRRCEHLIGNYDPCISCATHFLKMKIDRRPLGGSTLFRACPVVDRQTER